jgi:cyclomaltodextrinase
MKGSHRIRILVLSFVAAVGLAAGCSKKEEIVMSLDEPWLCKADSSDIGESEQWFRLGFDRSEWQPEEIGPVASLMNLPAPSGARWYATIALIGKSSAPVSIFFGTVENRVDLWIDGQHIGGSICHSDPCVFDLPADIMPGKKELVVRVSTDGAMGRLYKPVCLVPKDQVLELYRTDLAGTRARQSQDWILDAVIYEVYLRSFSHQGSFKVLEQRLPELKELGATVLWLMPIHPVGELNRKGSLGSPYSVQDYYAVNPEFGTLEDFKSLVRSVHSQGMKIIIDLVANHTAWDSKLVMEHPDWFMKNEEGAIVSPNPDWSDVAKLNYGHHELRKYMIEMMKYWIREADIDGFRCDVAAMVPTDFWEHARAELDKIKPVMMLSEGTLPEHHVEAFDATYSWTTYDLLSNVIDGTASVKGFDDILKTERYRFPEGALRLRFNTNHDMNVWDAPAVLKFSPKGAKTTAVFAFSFPGIPLVYNGEEAGNDRKLSSFEKVDIDWRKNLEFRAFYQVLADLRSSHVALRRGDYVSVPNTGGGKVLSFIRQKGDDQVLVVLNLSREQRKCDVAVPMFKTSELEEYFSKTPVSTSNGHLSLDMKGLDYMAFLPKANAGRGN